MPMKPCLARTTGATECLGPIDGRRPRDPPGCADVGWVVRYQTTRPKAPWEPVN